MCDVTYAMHDCTIAIVDVELIEAIDGVLRVAPHALGRLGVFLRRALKELADIRKLYGAPAIFICIECDYRSHLAQSHRIGRPVEGT